MSNKIVGKVFDFGICMSGFKRINVKVFSKEVLSCFGKLVQRVLKTKKFTQKKTPQQTMTDTKDFYRDILNCQCA